MRQQQPALAPMATTPRRQQLTLRLDPPPRRAAVPHLPHGPQPISRRPLTSRPLPPAVRNQALARAIQTVRYLERPVTLDGRPASLATYIVWERGRPRTFSFVRHDRRTDQARIVRVDEAARQVTALIPSMGVVVQTEVPLDAVVAYSQALSFDPPSPTLVARADAALSAGVIPGTQPGQGIAGSQPTVERTAGMRELLGRVTRVDAANRLITVEGGEEKTAFRVPEGIDLPNVGELVTLTTAPAPAISPPVATRVASLQPTVQGVLTHVRPLAVELWVRTVTPEGIESEVPVPISPDARIYQDGKLVPLRSLKEGYFVRAYITPAGELRIVSYRNGDRD
jgi:hypothetical protein